MPNSAEYIKERYEAYANERQILLQATLQLGGRYDQWMLTLSSGALGISLIFMENVPFSQEFSTAVCLGLGGFALVVTIIMGLLSIAAGHRSFEFQIEILDDSFKKFLEKASVGEYTGEDYRAEFDEPDNPYGKRAVIFNRGSLISFIVGILLLSWVFVLNATILVEKTP